MQPKAYYNEHDPFAAEWLRMLIACGLIADGDVDTRSIEDVRPNDLAGYTQVHLFAGIGGWSRAFRLAGVPDSAPYWSCSCPCQPFSAAGKGDGFADERHLWPSAFHLITQREPQRIFGEQVAAKSALAWLDLVCNDLEAAGYAVGAKDLCAASVGAAHIRQRLYWTADSNPSRCGEGRAGEEGNGGGSSREQLTGLCVARHCSDSDGRLAGNGDLQRSGQHGLLAEAGSFSEFADAMQSGRAEWWTESGNGSATRGGSACVSDNAIVPRLEGYGGNVGNSGKPGWLSEIETRSVTASGATRGFWSPADWWYGRDGKYRPIESGLFPLAHGVSRRMGRLRGYGNAIVPQVAAEFIKAALTQ